MLRSLNPHRNLVASAVPRHRAASSAAPCPRVAQSGFSLFEVLCALLLLTLGLCALAVLAVSTMTMGRTSKYMNLASTLASEKLEDLSRWTRDDPQICVPTASTSVGSLSSDVLQTTSCPPLNAANQVNSASVSYYDDVGIAITEGSHCPNAGTGCFAETIWNGTKYVTTYHSPDGSLQTANDAPAGMTFHRRWLVEADTPVTGMRRVTVQVTLKDTTVRLPATFQMSAVRP